MFELVVWHCERVVVPVSDWKSGADTLQSIPPESLMAAQTIPVESVVVLIPPMTTVAPESGPQHPRTVMQMVGVFGGKSDMVVLPSHASDLVLA
jgi:hypothetical protein